MTSSPSPNNKQSNTNKKNSLLLGVLIGVALVLLIGGGSCIVMLSNFNNSSAGSSSIDEEKALQQLAHNALNSDNNAKAKWLYAHALRNEELRAQLDPSITKEVAETQASKLIEQAIELEEPNVLNEQGMVLIEQSLQTNQNHESEDYIDYQKSRIYDQQLFLQGTTYLAKSYANTQCSYQSLLHSSSYEILNAIEGYDIATTDQTYIFQQLLSNPNIKKQPEPFYKIMALLLHEYAKCPNNYEINQLMIRQFLNFDDGYHIQHRAFDYVLVQVLKLEKIQDFIKFNIPETQTEAFEVEVRNIRHQYNALFDQAPEESAVAQDNLDYQKKSWLLESLLF